ncbi:hypothetical protein LX15_002024 [Streptoalloteichus tenebrarius]|uniref:Uncharacterized protein n=1 Tax=Streptoalloteichus tenebrarius (strain ATCC 17920 / DSM 40477 / JCM 4838 / CBS 697.72 / NBRC 16177 / NCIMB 11028 / NRRL B-12390 / A12253. 1 / ISP 5477) TaxID=1933 RepID=A0ABT1HS37_STRSD|nr:hypothetical protein [Streptoalloteichus tenebrarius]MCP2258330.1 hypothetical protein [Streptoalloteichus tenebrarius]BFF03496.1 hypothetical protein GCM10020241_51710 [Streptoalloteichus tenebrarius]
MNDRRAFLAFVKAHHPDVGGDPAAFVAGLAAFRGRPATAAPGNDASAPDRFDAPVTARPAGLRGVVWRWRDRRDRRARRRLR